MSTPPDASQEQDALKGWNHLTQVLAIWIPARLKITRHAGVGFDRLRKQGR